MRIGLFILLLVARANADEAAARKKIALGAVLCASADWNARLLKRIRASAAVLMKRPLSAELVTDISTCQNLYEKSRAAAQEAREALVEARLTTTPCSDKTVKRVTGCVLRPDSCESDPDLAIYLRVDGVPSLDFSE